MAETIRYARIGKEDLNLGTGTFEVRLADGRVVVLTQVDIGNILSDASLSSRTITLDTLTVGTLTVTGSQTTSSTLQIPQKADPSTALAGEIWINNLGTFPEFYDAAATPAKHEVVGHDTTQTLTNKTITSPTISGPTFSGTLIGTYNIGGTPTLTVALNANGQDITSLDELGLQDAAASATTSGRLRRNGVNLTFHDSVTVQTVTFIDATQTLTNKTLTSPTVNDPVINLTANAAPATPVANRIYSDIIVKGWVKFQIDGTIDDDVNVSSITDNGPGDWTINWATAFSNTTYAAVGSSSSNGVAGGNFAVDTENAPTTTACRMVARNSSTAALSDPTGTTPRLHAIAIGDQ